MSDDWKKSLPFPRHWLVYLLFKVAVLLLAGVIAWQALRSLEVI